MARGESRQGARGLAGIYAEISRPAATIQTCARRVWGLRM